MISSKQTTKSSSQSLGHKSDANRVRAKWSIRTNNSSSTITPTPSKDNNAMSTFLSENKLKIKRSKKTRSNHDNMMYSFGMNHLPPQPKSSSSTNICFLPFMLLDDEENLPIISKTSLLLPSLESTPVKSAMLNYRPSFHNISNEYNFTNCGTLPLQPTNLDAFLIAEEEDEEETDVLSSGNDSTSSTDEEVAAATTTSTCSSSYYCQTPPHRLSSNMNSRILSSPPTLRRYQPTSSDSQQEDVYALLDLPSNVSTNLMLPLL